MPPHTLIQTRAAIEPALFATKLLGSPVPVQALGTVLILIEQPGEEVRACGGLIAALRASGQRVDVAILRSVATTNLHAGSLRAQTARAAECLGLALKNIHYFECEGQHAAASTAEVCEELSLRVRALIDLCQSTTVIVPSRFAGCSAGNQLNYAGYHAAEFPSRALHLLEYPPLAAYTSSNGETAENLPPRYRRLELPELASTLGQKQAALHEYEYVTSPLLFAHDEPYFQDQQRPAITPAPEVYEPCGIGQH